MLTLRSALRAAIRGTSVPGHKRRAVRRRGLRAHAKPVRPDVGRLSIAADLRRVWKRALRLMTTLRAHRSPARLTEWKTVLEYELKCISKQGGCYGQNHRSHRTTAKIPRHSR